MKRGKLQLMDILEEPYVLGKSGEIKPFFMCYFLTGTKGAFGV